MSTRGGRDCGPGFSPDLFPPAPILLFHRPACPQAFLRIFSVLGSFQKQPFAYHRFTSEVLGLHRT